ncbi:protein kinase domain-containing protein [Streptomyces sp. CRN 30]|uniref:serine/threonine-protein kinase n=1 Tax=Streptomyces sp. CRN 30 TaxID=3075613 RepID=UPI002A82DFD1|nr:PQQ-binding-like beta-propeller repeat protein [Streptomyces sp. CRN 30]
MQALRETDPRHIGPYAVRARLGAGGMGEVYLAETPTGLRLAAKLVRAEHAEDRTFRARFRQEVRAARTVGGPGTYIARVLDADTEAVRPWMASEYVEGPTLRDAVLDHGGLPEEAVRSLAAALSEALVAIHAQGMVHRDLKPSNILLAPDGPRVIDFGIVRALEATALTRTGTVVGSVGYVSPEQIRNDGRVGPPSDIFALGAVLAYASAGREPFGEGRDAVILMRIMNRDYDLSGTPEGVRDLIEPCLRTEPSERPTAGELSSAIGHTAESLLRSWRPGWYTTATPALAPSERWLPGRDSDERESRVEYVAPPTATDGPTGTPPPPPPPSPSRRRLFQGIAAGTLAAGAGVGGWLWSRDRDGGGAGADKEGADAGVSPSTSVLATPRPAVVDWAYGTARLSEMGGPSVTLSPDGDTVYFGGVDGALHAVSASGRKLWETKLGEPPLYGGTVGAAVATDDGAYCLYGNGQKLCAVGVDGSVRWERASTEGARYGTMPVLAGELIVVSTDAFAKEHMVRAYASDGFLTWTASLPGEPDGPPAAVDDRIYVNMSSDSTVTLDAKDGRQLAAQETIPANRQRAANHPAVVPPDGTGSRSLVVHTENGRLTAVDRKDGAVVWTLDGHGTSSSDPTVHESLIYAFLGEHLFIVNRDGVPQHVLTFDETPVLPEYRPVVDSRHVYVATHKGIAAVDLPSAAPG